MMEGGKESNQTNDDENKRVGTVKAKQGTRNLLACNALSYCRQSSGVCSFSQISCMCIAMAILKMAKPPWKIAHLFRSHFFFSFSFETTNMETKMPRHHQESYKYVFLTSQSSTQNNVEFQNSGTEFQNCAGFRLESYRVATGIL